MLLELFRSKGCRATAMPSSQETPGLSRPQACVTPPWEPPLRQEAEGAPKLAAAHVTRDESKLNRTVIHGMRRKLQ